MMYLSFDDGPHPAWTPKILDLLGQHGAHATFFQIGSEAAQYPTIAARVRSGGNAVGNHTWDHRDLTALPAEGVAAQVTRTTAVIGATRCTRPPMGLTNPAVVAALGRQGQRQQMWDIDTRDWQRPGAARIVDTVVGQARSGAVILMHDGGGDRSQTVDALAQLLPRLTRAGWRLEAIPGC
ncbi:MAG TPA: polysaccharide deacetylase family protein [Intrasporangiaceae bacterium]|nr:polysaccharide deacetylase family protein [Intrasporangiaceae bacterium]